MKFPGHRFVSSQFSSSSSREGVLLYRHREVHVLVRVPELREEEAVEGSRLRDPRAADRAAPRPEGGEERGGDRRDPG